MLSSCHHLQLVLFLYLCLTAGLWATANGRDDMSEEHVTNSSDERSSPGPPSPEEAHGREDGGIDRSRTLTAHGELPRLLGTQLCSKLVLLLYLCLTAGLRATSNVGGVGSEETVTIISEVERSSEPRAPEQAHGLEDGNIDQTRTMTNEPVVLDTSTGNTTRHQDMQVIANLLSSVLMSGEQHSPPHAFARVFDQPQMQSDHQTDASDSILNGTDSLPQLLQTSCTGIAYAVYLRYISYPIRHYLAPLLVSDAVVIQERPETYPYEALLMFGMKSPDYLHTYGLHAYVFEVGQNDGQTMRVHDFLDLSFLPRECQNPNAFFPVLALNSARNLVFIYNFGFALNCSKLIIYNPSNRSIQHVETTGDELVPRWFSSMVSVLLPNDVIKANIFLFGGTHCNPDAILECDNFSDAIFEMRFTDTSMSSGKWSILTISSNSHRPSGRVSSALFVGQNNTLILYGGINVGENYALAKRPHKAECDLWLFNIDTGEWLNVGNLELDCESRDSSSCFDYHSNHTSPSRPWTAYSASTNEISVFSWRFLPSIRLRKKVGLCFSNNVTVSRRLVGGCRENQWRSDFFSVKKWLIGPPLFEPVGSVYRTAFVAVRHDHYLVDSYTMRLFNVSSTFDFISGKDSVSLKVLPTLDIAFQFPGSLGCASSPIVLISEQRGFERADFPGPHALMIGGSCVLPSHPGYLDIFAPVWKTMPVWRYSFGHIHGEGKYDMRIIEPGPPFRNQILHTLVKLEDERSIAKAILFGGISLSDGFMAHDVWCFDTAGFYWTKANITSPAAEAPYQHNLIAAGHIAVALDKTNFLVYGGFDIGSSVAATSEIFIFTFSNLSSCTGSWTNLSAAVQSSSGVKLPKLVFHCATFWHDRVFVYGGRSSIFLFERSPLLTLKVSIAPLFKVQLEEIHLSASLGPRLLASIIPYNSEMLLIFGGLLIEQRTMRIAKKHSRVSTLIHLDPTNSSNAVMLPFFQSVPIAFHHLSEGMPMAFGGGTFPNNNELDSQNTAITYTRFCQLLLPNERCPLGYGYSKDNNTCYECNIDSMSDTTEGPCQPCRQFQTTNGTGATSCYTPNPCDDAFCHGHGSCLVRNHIVAYCDSCNFGYWRYDNCRAPFIYIFISTSVAMAMVFLLYMLKRIRDARKKTKRQERDLQITKWHLMQLKNGVMVQWCELELERVLGEGASGQVHLATLGDTHVAVKALRRCRMNDNIFLERFSKEIENMRTVRHPNIVMFLGAGTEPTRQFPFIVMEYVMQGSLFNILQCSDVPLPLERKVNFAHHVGKGMEFLHSSTTPRIHCDLKSSNLLVTSNWQVKIGDFGMLRLISTIRDYDDTDPEDNLMQNSPVFRRGITSWEESTAPLLQAAGDDNHAGRNLTLAMGTARWCSPETLRHHVFNKYTDVYSYGIVLWEVLTRQLPYNHVDDENQVVEEIKNGWRPPIPPAHPEAYKYKRLMEACWSDEPEQRPLFPEIVAEMEEQLRVISVANHTALQ